MTRSMVIGAGIVFALASSTLAQPVYAQPEAAPGWQRPALLLPVTAVTPTLNPAVQAAKGGKSALLAGVLSWFVFPGVGSFYAGNSGHGVRHLVIGVVTLGGGLTALGLACHDGDCSDGAGVYPALGAFGLYTANAVWSIFVAINDVEAYNRRLGTTALEVAPALKVLRSRLASGRTSVGISHARLGVQVARLVF